MIDSRDTLRPGSTLSEKKPMMKMRTSPGSVVKVGGGRGFIVATRVNVPAMKSPPCTINGITRPGRLIPAHPVEHRLIVTAAHCLPKMPPRRPSFFTERTYKDLWGALDGTCDASKNALWAECLFADPIGDVAILGPPDGQGGTKNIRPPPMHMMR